MGSILKGIGRHIDDAVARCIGGTASVGTQNDAGIETTAVVSVDLNQRKVGIVGVGLSQKLGELIDVVARLVQQNLVENDPCDHTGVHECNRIDTGGIGDRRVRD